MTLVRVPGACALTLTARPTISPVIDFYYEDALKRLKGVSHRKEYALQHNTGRIFASSEPIILDDFMTIYPFSPAPTPILFDLSSPRENFRNSENLGQSFDQVDEI